MILTQSPANNEESPRRGQKGETSSGTPDINSNKKNTLSTALEEISGGDYSHYTPDTSVLSTHAESSSSCTKTFLNDRPATLEVSNTNKDTMVHRHIESPHRQSSLDDGDDEAVLKQKLGSVSNHDNEHEDHRSDDCPVRKSKNHHPTHAEKLLQALDVLNGLATMESCDYQASLLDKDARLTSDSQIQTLLATTPQLIKLHQSIHRFHSLIRNLTAENDQQTMDLLELHQQLQAKTHRLEQLETAVTTLYKRNTKLKARTKSSQSKARKLFQHVQEFTANATKRKQDEDFSKLAMQLEHHESIMNMNRERTDSNFSDLDGLQDFDGGGSDLDTVSTTSSVYDDGVATLRISRERTSTWPPMEGQDVGLLVHLEGKDDVGSKDLVATSERGIETPDSTPSRRSETKPQNGNPFAMFLGPRIAQPYTLYFLEPFELQFAAIIVDKHIIDGKKSPEEPEQETAFAVCGHHGLDTYFNIKPAIGARLLQINKQVLDPSWTVQDLEKHIKSLGKRANMTFRNDSWSKGQKGTLQLAVQEQERLHPESLGSILTTNPLMVNPFTRKPRSQSKDDVAASIPSGSPNNSSHHNKNHLLGFLNFHNSSDSTKVIDAPKSIKDEDRQQSEVTVKTSHAVPTGSSGVTRIGSHDSSQGDGGPSSLNSPMNQGLSSLWRKSMTASSARPNEIHTTNSTSSSNEECFSFQGDREQSSLFMPMATDTGKGRKSEGAVIVDVGPIDVKSDMANRSSGHVDGKSTFTIDWNPGCVVKLEGLPEKINRRRILQLIASSMNLTAEEVKKRKLVKVDLVKGHSTEAVLRFSKPDEAITKLIDSLDKGDLTIEDVAITRARLLKGEEEEMYWKDFMAYKSAEKQFRQSSSEGSTSIEITGDDADKVRSCDKNAQDAGEKFKSSMKQMGRIFAFR